MRHFFLACMVASGIFTFDSRLAYAQEPASKQVRDFVEFKLPKEPAFVRGEIIVKMKSGKSIAAAALLNLSVEPTHRRTSGDVAVYRIKPSVAKTLGREKLRRRTLALVSEFKRQPDVEYAQPNYLFRLANTPNDPDFSKQWHYFNNGKGPDDSPGGISLPRAWRANVGSGTIVVAVLDTGILLSHPDIAGAGNLVAGYDMISDFVRANDRDPSDPSLLNRDKDPTDPGDMTSARTVDMPEDCEEVEARTPYNTWHGTHVAGIVGAGGTNNLIGIAGVNWQIKVQPVRVTGRCGADSWDVKDGIRWAAGLPVSGISDNTTQAQVINLSVTMRGQCSSMDAPNMVVRDAIAEAVAKGVVVVAAAGNSNPGEDVSDFTPASCNDVITVAASDHLGNLASYSNYGDRIDIMAPGGDLSSSDINGVHSNGVYSMVKDGYTYYEGTSMAAPHVAGVAALLLAQDPTLTRAQLLAKLKAMALPRTASQCPKPCGAGLLQASVNRWFPPWSWAIKFWTIILVVIIAIAFFMRFRRQRPRGPLPPYTPQQYR